MCVVAVGEQDFNAESRIYGAKSSLLPALNIHAARRAILKPVRISRYSGTVAAHIPAVFSGEDDVKAFNLGNLIFDSFYRGHIRYSLTPPVVSTGRQKINPVRRTASLGCVGGNVFRATRLVELNPLWEPLAAVRSPESLDAAEELAVA